MARLAEANHRTPTEQR